MMRSIVFILSIATGFVTNNGVHGTIISTVCDTLVTALPIPDSCGCTGGLTTQNGVNLNINCTLSNDICIPGVSLCGAPSFQGNYYQKTKQSTTTLGFDIGDLFGLNIVNPAPFTLSLVHKAPLQLINPINLASCSAKYGSKTCSSCTICNNGKGFKFDCSNVSILDIGVIDLKLPKINACLGLPL